MTDVKRFYALAVVLLVVAGLLALTLVQPVIGSRTEFSVVNPGWSGTSGFARDVHATGALVPAFNVDPDAQDLSFTSFAGFTVDPAGSSLLVVAPTRPPDAAEAEWLRDFVESGGRVLVADATGEGNAFLAALGAASRFNGTLVKDLAFTRNPALVVTVNPEPHVVTFGVHEVALNHGTVIDVAGDARVIGRTSAFSWLGEDVPVRPDGRYPWLAVETVGDGEVLLVSDPSVLVNGMRPVADNARFAANAAAWLAADRDILIAESHRDYPDPVGALGTTVRALPDAARYALTALAAVGFLAFAAGGAARDHAAGPTRALRRLLDQLLPPPERPAVDLVQRVRARHPDWEAGRLERILEEWRRETVERA